MSADAVASGSPWRGSFSFAATVLPRPRRWGDKMVEILNFSRETAFTPENIQILAAALDEAWERFRRFRQPINQASVFARYARGSRETHHGNGPAWRARP
jgi:hypothetical protein